MRYSPSSQWSVAHEALAAHALHEPDDSDVLAIAQQQRRTSATAARPIVSDPAADCATRILAAGRSHQQSRRHRPARRAGAARHRVASIDIARRILGPERDLEPRFIWVPIDLQNPLAIEALAGIVTLTPGTLTADVTADRRYLLVHAFDVDDEAAVIAQIRSRYEAPLSKIFPAGDEPT